MIHKRGYVRFLSVLSRLSSDLANRSGLAVPQEICYLLPSPFKGFINRRSRLNSKITSACATYEQNLHSPRLPWRYTPSCCVGNHVETTFRCFRDFISMQEKQKQGNFRAYGTARFQWKKAVETDDLESHPIKYDKPSVHFKVLTEPPEPLTSDTAHKHENLSRRCRLKCRCGKCARHR